MSKKTKEKMLPLTTPGEVLAEEFLAQDIAVPRVRINGIVRGVRAITPDTALRLGQYFGTTPQFWLNLQIDYDLRKLQREGALPKIQRCAQLPAAA
jgi:addiction module HigA family antidote